MAFVSVSPRLSSSFPFAIEGGAHRAEHVRLAVLPPFWSTYFLQLTYTCVIVFVNQTAQNLDNYLPPGAIDTFTAEDIKNAIYGSKCVFITEEFMLATLWLCKACLLILYSSLT